MAVSLTTFPLKGQAQRNEFFIEVVGVISYDENKKPLTFPISVCYNAEDEDIIVVEATESKLIFYTPDLFPYFSIGPGRGILVPKGICTDRSGNLYVAQGLGALNQKEPKISIFNRAAIISKEIKVDFVPTSLAVDEKGNIYAISYGKPKCYVLSPEGKLIKTISPTDRLSPEEKTREAKLSDVFIDSRGRIYLLSEEMGRLYVYSQNGTFIFKAGEKGGTPGKLSRPRGVAADPKAGFIYITDYMRHTIQILDYYTGKYLGEVGGRGFQPGWFNYPTDITVDPRGNIYVCDLFNRRVQVLRIKER